MINNLTHLKTKLQCLGGGTGIGKAITEELLTLGARENKQQEKLYAL